MTTQNNIPTTQAKKNERYKPQSKHDVSSVQSTPRNTILLEYATLNVDPSQLQVLSASYWNHHFIELCATIEVLLLVHVKDY